MFINIHSHRSVGINEWCIQNIHKDFEYTHRLFHYSMGIHPWYIDTTHFKVELEKMSIAVKKEEVIAIGECGLDRICETPFAIQQEAFRAQIRLANETAKPILIHCVRAHREIISILEEYPLHVPVIFHGFNNNETIAQQLIAKGYFLSFGASLFNPSSQSTFSKLPLEKIFLETDDSDKKIQDIYQQASTIKNISLDQLHLQLHKNYREVFNHNLL